MRARGLPSSSATLPEAGFLFSELSSYLKREDVSELQNVYLFSQSAHSGQFRQSGEPYISHPLAVASILGKLRLDTQTLAAALLHDVMEDTHVSKAEISDRFGKPVAELVDGVSKLDKIEFQTYADAQAENFRKMLLAMAQDVRVILIKLADRLHNMRTLEAMRPEKRRRIARETMEIYAPIANRLGLNNIYQELQDLSFRYVYPTRYRVLANATKAARGNRREMVTKILDAIRQRLKAAGLDAEVSGREKQLYSIYKKMAEKHLTFSEVLDIYGFRVIVKDVPSCYIALGALHSLYNPIPGKFKDYIAIPKANGYQSLHSTLWGPYGTPIEIQIRTPEMHRIAEAGVASHWLYKSTDADLNDLHMKTHQWLQSLLETLSDSSDSLEFLEHIKVDLFPGEVYVFTPQGKILALPKDSTAVDFAYAVHTDIGDCCVAAKINGEKCAFAHGSQKRRPGGDRYGITCQTQPCLAQLCRYRQGALPYPPFSQDNAIRRVGKAGGASVESGFSLAQDRSSDRKPRPMGQAGARERSQVPPGFACGYRVGKTSSSRDRAEARVTGRNRFRHNRSWRCHHDIGQRGHGGAICQMLPAYTGRFHCRLYQKRSGTGDSYP